MTREHQPREYDTHCRIHGVALGPTGYCERAEAWWYPQFVCPTCRYRLWDNGYCEHCTPRTAMFTGDYFEARWDSEAGKAWGHYVRVNPGPTPALTMERVVAHLAELREITREVGHSIPKLEPGDLDEVPF